MPEPDDAPVTQRRRWWSRRRDQALATPIGPDGPPPPEAPGPPPLDPILEHEPPAPDERDLEDRIARLERHVSSLDARLRRVKGNVVHDVHGFGDTNGPEEAPEAPASEAFRQAVEALKAEIETVRKARHTTAPQDKDV